MKQKSSGDGRLLDGLVQEVFNEVICLDRDQRADHLPDVARDEAVDLRQGEAVEGRCNWNCVSAHVLEDDEVTDAAVWQWNVSDELVESVTCWTPDGAGELLLVNRTLLQELRLDMLVIVEQAVERPIDTVIDVVHDVIDVVSDSVVNVLLRLNVRHEGESRSDVEATRFGNDTDILVREENFQALVHNRCDTVNGLVAVSGKPSADVQQSHLEAELFSFFEQLPAQPNRLVVDRVVAAARANMETDAHDVHVEIAGNFEQFRGLGDGIATELLAQGALSFFSFAANAENQTEMDQKQLSDFNLPS